MSRLKRIAGNVVKWSWFVLLVMLAFGYLASGLSDPERYDNAGVSAQQVHLGDRDPLGDSKLGRNGLPIDDSPSISMPGDSMASNDSDKPDEPVAELIGRVDRAWADSLEKQGYHPAPRADWMQVCRRMSLALVGNGLSLEEIRNLESIPLERRESVHLENLLNDSRFHHYWAERWARYLVGTDEGQFIVYRRRRFRIWLSEVLAQNRPYDQMVRDLITAEGLWTDKPQVNFITATFDSNEGQADPVRLAARTSRAFLGLRIDCLQCHNDFLGNVNLGDVQNPREGLQSDFHQLAAFFTSAKTNGLQGVKEKEADYRYKYLDAEDEQQIEPAVPFYAELLPSEGSPRQRLAAWVTDPRNHQAARAAVSHVWALMYGRPPGEAVDNLPLDEPGNPMVEVLASDFVEHGFDLRRLIRGIAGSAAFCVDSRAEFTVTDDHERAHAVFPLVRLRPEQVAGSIIQAARIKKTDRQSSLILQFMQMTGINQFVTQYGDVGEDEFTTDSVTITQRLLMMNGDMLSELINSNPFLNASAHIGMFAPDNDSAVETVYLCVLNRYPSEDERRHFVKRLDDAEQRDEAIEDLFWVLTNSSELAWNH